MPKFLVVEGILITHHSIIEAEDEQDAIEKSREPDAIINNSESMPFAVQAYNKELVDHHFPQYSNLIED